MYEQLTKNIGKIKEGVLKPENQKGDGSSENPYIMPWFEYEENIQELMHIVYDIIPYKGVDYVSALEKYKIRNDGNLEQIDVSNLPGDIILCLFMAVSRGDRFSEGYINEHIKNGCFEKWLLRLKEIDDNDK